MERYINKDAVVAEIKKRIKEHHSGYLVCLKDILSFINTLETKEVDLEEKATQLSQKYFPDEENIWARANIEAQKCKSACIEMAEWLKAQKGE